MMTCRGKQKQSDVSLSSSRHRRTTLIIKQCLIALPVLLRPGVRPWPVLGSALAANLINNVNGPKSGPKIPGPWPGPCGTGFWFVRNCFTTNFGPQLIQNRCRRPGPGTGSTIAPIMNTKGGVGVDCAGTMRKTKVLDDPRGSVARGGPAQQPQLVVRRHPTPSSGPSSRTARVLGRRLAGELSIRACS